MPPLVRLLNGGGCGFNGDQRLFQVVMEVFHAASAVAAKQCDMFDEADVPSFWQRRCADYTELQQGKDT